MKRCLVILTEIISPYRLPLFNCLAQDSDIDLHVIFLSESDPSLRQWKVYKEEIKFSYKVLPSWRRRVGKFNVLLTGDVLRALREAAPDAILCGGYSYIASWQALWWARLRRVPFLLWSESNQHDARNGLAPIESLKGIFLRACSGYIAAGRASKDYLCSHAVSEHKIFIAPNAVDNELFCRGAVSARRDASAKRRVLDLPDRYFLFVGRLVPEKGVFDLLAAYTGLSQELRREVGLVFVGDGASRKELEKQATAVSPGTVMFSGFVHREDLPAYYGLAEVFVFPTYTDPWGLVVNEAMACGLPVIISGVAGCVPDLIRQDWNGLLVSPKDIPSLTAALTRLASQTAVREQMGNHSVQLISQYSPQQWSLGIADAVRRTLNNQ